MNQFDHDLAELKTLRQILLFGIAGVGALFFILNYLAYMAGLRLEAIKAGVAPASVDGGFWWSVAIAVVGGSILLVLRAGAPLMWKRISKMFIQSKCE